MFCLVEAKDGSEDRMFAAARDPKKSANKQAMKFVKDKASKKKGVKFFSPGGKPEEVPGTTGVNAYVLGPPRDESLLTDEDPVEDEGFPGDGSHGLTFAAATASDAAVKSPFRNSFCIRPEKAMTFMARGFDDLDREFFEQHYGQEPNASDTDAMKEVPDNAEWRRIDDEWLFSAESLALKVNRGINNTSLVLGFELPHSKKILLFVGDAQRGNWISWAKNDWLVDGEKVTAKDLLSRTVLYKCGHHGSHNATLAGKIDDQHLNLSWMGLGTAASEFTSMITAVNEWAMTKNNPPWRHPLKSIRDALDMKCQGRVFQTDRAPEKPDDVSDSEWAEFQCRSTVDELFFEYVIVDE